MTKAKAKPKAAKKAPSKNLKAGRLNNMLKRKYGTSKVSKEQIEAACLAKYGQKTMP